jgi:hypothetical protein
VCLLIDNCNLDFLKKMLELNFTFNISNNHASNSIDLTSKILLVNYSIVMLLGLIGNFSTVYVALCCKNTQKITNIYISNLALADLLVVVLVIPENALRLLQLQPPDFCRRIFCKYTGFFQGNIIIFKL